MRLVSFLIESCFWVLSFLSPVFGGFLISAIVYSAIGLSFVGFVIILSISLLVGISFAERNRRKYGSSIYWGKIYETPDIWPVAEGEKDWDRAEKKRES